jgi:hypothetical protein
MLYTVGRTPWTGDQPVTRPLLAHRTAQGRPFGYVKQFCNLADFLRKFMAQRGLLCKWWWWCIYAVSTVLIRVAWSAGLIFRSIRKALRSRRCVSLQVCFGSLSATGRKQGTRGGILQSYTPPLHSSCRAYTGNLVFRKLRAEGYCKGFSQKGCPLKGRRSPEDPAVVRAIAITRGCPLPPPPSKSIKNHVRLKLWLKI